MITKNWTLPRFEAYLLTLNRKNLIHLQIFTYLTQGKNGCLTFVCFTWAQAQLHFNHFALKKERNSRFSLAVEQGSSNTGDNLCMWNGRWAMPKEFVRYKKQQHDRKLTRCHRSWFPCYSSAIWLYPEFLTESLGNLDCEGPLEFQPLLKAGLTSTLDQAALSSFHST